LVHREREQGEKGEEGDPQSPGAGNNGKTGFNWMEMGAERKDDYTVGYCQYHHCDGKKNESGKEYSHECIGRGNANCIHVNGDARFEDVGGLWGDGFHITDDRKGMSTTGCERSSS